MIYLLLLLDRDKSIGIELHNAGKFSFDSDLLISLVQTILILSDEIGDEKPKGAFREIEIGEYQIGVVQSNNLAYIFVQDTYDNEPFTKLIIDKVINEFHSVFMKENLNYGLNNIESIRERVSQLLTTMTFPDDLLQKADDVMYDVLSKIPAIDTLFLADLDDGMVRLWASGGENIVNLLLGILSEIPFERSWMGETRLFRKKTIKGQSKNNEAWIIQRIGFTDFCILARCVFNPDERDFIISTVEAAAEQLQSSIFEKLENGYPEDN